jgi:hypothetical protein
MLNDLQASSAADRKMVYWHRELPPIDAEPLGEHIVEADSMRVAGNLAHRDDLWDQCYRDLMAQVHLRLDQEVHRLGGDCAHVLDETIGSKHDDGSGEVWLHGRITYLLLRRPGSAPSASRSAHARSDPEAGLRAG